ncbi:MAG: PAS domain S-box protein [Deltaproteobacteria bacterium]|nr:PAS domain S-box protein [Deltaproteobacteria bacterium]
MEDARKTKKQLIEELNCLRLEQIEQTRLTSEKFTKAFLQNSIPTIITTVKDGIVVEVSDDFLRLVGKKRDEVIGHTAVGGGFITKEQRASFFNELNKSGRIENFEMEIRPQSGVLRYGLFNAVMISVNNEIYLLTNIQDITERKQVEQALRESESKLNAMLQSMPDHMSMMDKELNLVWANEAAKRTFGNDIIGKKCYEAYHRRKEPCEPYPCLTLKAFNDGGIHEHEIDVVDAAGKAIYFHCTATTVLRDKDERPITVIEISRDITERKQAEEALRILHNLVLALTTCQTVKEALEHILDAALRDKCLDSGGIYLNDPVNSTMNLAVTCGHSPEMVEHTSHLAADSPQVIRARAGTSFYGRYTALWPPGKDETRDREGLTALASIPVLHKGNLVAIMNMASHVHDDIPIHTRHLLEMLAAQIGGILVYIHSEEKLRESRQQLHHITDNIPVFVNYVNAQNLCYKYVNKYFANLFGKLPEEIVGRQVKEILPADVYQRALPYIDRALSGKRIRYENMVPIQGEPRWFSIDYMPEIDEQGSINTIIILGFDISEQKQAGEELERYREHLEHMVKERTTELESNNITLHELNTALTVLLKKREDDKKDLEERFVTNIQNLVLPYIEFIKRGHLDVRQLTQLDIMEAHLRELATPLLKNLRQFNLTPKEIKVATLVRQGKSTKEITEILGIGSASIDIHRKNIRKKLGLSNRNINLESHLAILE